MTASETHHLPGPICNKVLVVVVAERRAASLIHVEHEVIQRACHPRLPVGIRTSQHVGSSSSRHKIRCSLVRWYLVGLGYFPYLSVANRRDVRVGS